MFPSRMFLRPFRTPLVLTVLGLVVMPLLVAGCGSKSVDDEAVLAQVGDREITAGYYQKMLAKMQPNQLPRDAAGEAVDTSTLAGKQAFLDVLINKELMVLTGFDLGYDQDSQITMAKDHLVQYHAMTIFWADEIGDPAGFVSNEDLDYYYSRLGEKRECDFIIADFEDQAREAREAAQNGMSWDEIVKKYHSPYADPARETKIIIPWGQYRDDFERAIFTVEVGEVTEPIRTQYGYWVLRVNGIDHEDKPDLDAIKVRVLESIRQRNMNLAREDLINEAVRRHNLEVDEQLLMTAFLGLPEGEQIIDPDTGQPTHRDELRPLDVPTDELEKVLLSYNLSTGPRVFTLGDYKARFDEMNVFDRPKKNELLGGFRERLIEDAEKDIIVDEARTRGYFEDPRTHEGAMAKIEEMLVEKVHQEVIQFEEYVSPEEIEVFWQEHKEEYFVPETRHGHMVSCKDQETALQAREAILAEKTWKQINNMFGNDAELEKNFGRLHAITETQEGPARDILFSLEIDDLTQPIETEKGWVIVKLERIEEARQPDMNERLEAVGQRIRTIRQDQALDDVLQKWRAEYSVTVDEGILEKMPSHTELTTRAQDLEVVVETPAGDS